ncbi:hypothetical protein GEV39_06640 [Pseudomonas sp. NY5710]|nr:hypothetical protein GEV39_06640 [Pseudomonas sp. NY5710]
MAGHREPPCVNDCPSVCQARTCGQRFRFYWADSYRPPRANCTVQNARPCKLHGSASAKSSQATEFKRLFMN